MNSKAIRKQLLAAVAMVLVAAVALGSSTYAWFVSNNTVKATTATISAQSNAPFLMIDKTAISSTSQTAISFTEANVALYPAQWADSFTAVGGTTASTKPGETGNNGKYQFESAYASSATAQTMLAGSRFAVGEPATAAGDAASGGGYAIHEQFRIGTADDKAGSFKNLKVANVKVNNATSSQLENALTVLVMCQDSAGANKTWGVYKKSVDDNVKDAVELVAYANGGTNVINSLTGDGVTDALASTIAAGDYVLVDIYVFYDGSDNAVFTNNLTNLKDVGMTLTFTATPIGTNGSTGAGNAATSGVSVSAAATSGGVNATVNNGTGTITYQWMKATTENGDYSNIDGKTTAALTGLTNADNGWYKCVIKVEGISYTTNAVQVNIT